MREDITATIVYKDSHKRYYRLSKPISRGVSDLTGEVDSIVEGARDYFSDLRDEEYRKRVLDKLNSDVIKYDDKEGWNLIAISDAHTHSERLVFLAMEFDGELGHTGSDIAGRHTYRYYGGGKVYSDEALLRFLASYNNYNWKGIVETN